MAFDEELAERVRKALAPRSGVVEKRMFGGVCFMIGGHMAIGVEKDRLMIRLPVAEATRLLREPYVIPMDFTGRVMRSFIFVAAGGVRTQANVRKWATRAADHAEGMKPRPPRWKKKKAKARKRSAPRKAAPKKAAPKQEAAKKVVAKKAVAKKVAKRARPSTKARSG